ncbi:deoxyribonuclease IV [Halalkalibacter urbisdiaboli]|uniref:deoxyribonuclease IV n=1 Tax=Halalkalibacter urbisdiaboli TaxID=1960589 RepID=UPI000B44B001|nr:deoxyribonuclease IV [Halalkalibacter urbisdiaboli]
MYIGSHVSIKHGYLHAAKATHALGGKAFQYFPKNPRSLMVKEFSHDDASACLTFCKEQQIKSVAHTPYPTKLIPDKREIEDRIIDSILNDLHIAEACGSVGIVVHFGTTKTIEIIEAYQKMIEMLNRVLAQWDGQAKLLIENNAGGTNMGITLEEMVQVRELTDDPSKIGFCFDTCHAFASGLWNGEDWIQVVEKGEELGYFEHLEVIHMNNSKYPFRSRKDRHANLTKGHISPEQIQMLIHSKALKNKLVILETPKDEGITHQDEISLLNKWSFGGQM